MRICNICEERELPARTRFPNCSVCRANMGGWYRKGVAAILEYRRRLKVRETRMDNLVEEKDFTANQRRKLLNPPPPKSIIKHLPRGAKK